MTPFRLLKIAEQIDLRMFSMQPRIAVDDDIRSMTVRIVVTYRALDRETGKSTMITQERRFEYDDILRLRDDEHALHLLRSEVERAVLHELDESFLVCGRRIFDPHGDKLRGYGIYGRAVGVGWTLPDNPPPRLPEGVLFPDGQLRMTLVRRGRIRWHSDAPSEAPIYDEERFEYLRTGELVGGAGAVKAAR